MKNSRSKNSRQTESRLIPVASVAENGSVNVELVTPESIYSERQPKELHLLRSRFFRFSIIVDGKRKRGGVTSFWKCIHQMLQAANAIHPSKPQEVVFTMEQEGREVIS